ncbi:M48 family metallopeptidase [Endothiovibrio diazotrophicus]
MNVLSIRRIAIAMLLTAAAVTTLPARAFDLGGLDLNTAMRAGSAALKGLKEVTPQQQYHLGRAVAAQLFEAYPLVRDKKKSVYLTTLATYLARYSSLPETYAGYRVGIIKGKAPNAFAAPGGMILLTEGLVALAQNEEQLAAVVAHEIAHVALGHGVAVLKTANFTEAGAIVGEAQLSRKMGGAGAMGHLFSQSVSAVVQKLVVNGYSQDQEFDADREAVRILYRAGYDPTAATALLQRLAARNQKAGEHQGFAATHPAPTARLDKVKKVLAAESLSGEEGKARTQRFKRSM